MDNCILKVDNINKRYKYNSVLEDISFSVNKGEFLSLLGPSGCGKTTMLRDITRNISNGMYSINLKGRKVSVIDERSEIGACYFGVPQTNVGIRTDILDNCLKREGLIMAVRSLSPEVIICDEIGTKGDIEALMGAFNSGVNIITTIHGFTIDDLYKRKIFKDLLDNNVLERAVILSSKDGVGTIEKVYNLEGGEKICLKWFFYSWLLWHVLMEE